MGAPPWPPHGVPIEARATKRCAMSFAEQNLPLSPIDSTAKPRHWSIQLRAQFARSSSLNASYFKNVEVYRGGDEELAERPRDGQKSRVGNVQHSPEAMKTIFEDTAKLVEVGGTKRTKASREMYSMLARFTGSRAATIVRCLTGLNGVET